MVTMPNAPGMLSLGGSAGNGGEGWLWSYERWTQALAVRDLLAVREALKILVNELTQWLGAKGITAANAQRAFWGSYLSDAMRTRGFNTEAESQLGTLAQLELGEQWTPAATAEIMAQEVTVQEITQMGLRGYGSNALFAVSAWLSRDEQIKESVTVRGNSEFVEFSLVSKIWWSTGTVGNVENAESIATRLVIFALDNTGWDFLDVGDVVDLREVVARVGDQEVRLGWEPKEIPIRTLNLGRYWYRWLYRDFPQAWLLLLLTGDRRVRLRVRPDGRASLRIPRQFLHESL